MKYPMNVEQVLKVFRITSKGASAEAEDMLAAVIRLANSAYEDGFKAGQAAVQGHRKGKR